MKQLLSAISLAVLATPLPRRKQHLGDYLDVFTGKSGSKRVSLPRRNHAQNRRCESKSPQETRGSLWQSNTEEQHAAICKPGPGYAAIGSGRAVFMSAIGVAHDPGGVLQPLY